MRSVRFGMFLTTVFALSLAGALADIVSTGRAAAAISDPSHGHDYEGHGHEGPGPIEVGHDADAPSLALEVKRIGEGWRAELQTENFRFSRANADGAHRPGEGHAHLYVNGEKTEQIYAPSVALPPLPAGTHVVTVTLNANDRRFYARHGAPIAKSVTFEIGNAESGSEPGAAPVDGRPHAIPVILLDGVRESDDPIRFIEGEKAAMVVLSNEAMTLHLHGYNIEVSAKPGEPAAIRFVAHTAGRFPVERHGGGGHSALFYIEIYPN